ISTGGGTSTASTGTTTAFGNNSTGETPKRKVAGSVPGALVLGGGDLGWIRGSPLLVSPAASSRDNASGSVFSAGAADPHGAVKNAANSHGPLVSTGGPSPGGRSGGQPLTVSTGLGFAGLNTNDAGGIIEPPDTIAAAGPTAIVELVNSNIA